MGQETCQHASIVIARLGHKFLKLYFSRTNRADQPRYNRTGWMGVESRKKHQITSARRKLWKHQITFADEGNAYGAYWVYFKLSLFDSTHFRLDYIIFFRYSMAMVVLIYHDTFAGICTFQCDSPLGLLLDTGAEAIFNVRWVGWLSVALSPQKPWAYYDGSPDGHLDFHTAPELCVTFAAAAAVVFLNVLGCRLTY